MSLNPPKPEYVGQVWVDPIEGKPWVWTGWKDPDAEHDDYWEPGRTDGWQPWHAVVEPKS
jgi:hypothetical protein